MKNLVTLVLVLFTINSFSQQKAFTTAYGGGSNSAGGRGYPVYHVTNLSAFGAGSFTQALVDAKETNGGNVVFDVSGTIYFSDDNVWQDLKNISILGQTAPQGGITFTSKAGTRTLLLYSNNVIIRYIKFRHEWLQDANDAMDIISSSDIIFDHCSLSWGGDEAISTRSWIDIPSNNITFQRLLMGECKTGNLMGNGDDYDNGINQSTHKNLYFNVSHRFPNVSSNGRIDIINNVVYDWNSRMSNFFGSAQVNYINNYFGLGQKAPFSVLQDGNSKPLNMIAYDNVDYDLQIYATGTYIENTFTDLNADNKTLFYIWENGGTSDTYYAQNVLANENSFTDTQYPLLSHPVPILSATDNFTDVLADVGANAYIDDNGVPQRESDAIDTDYINIINAGGFENYENNAGKFLYDVQPRYIAYMASITETPINTRPLGYDDDGDGINDAWFAANVTGGATANDLAPRGYTWLEEYLNQVDNSQDTVLQVQACKLITPPVIDGTEDYIWSNIPSHNMGVTEIGLTLPDPSNLSANFKIAWDVNSLYFFIKVKDDILFSDSPPLDFFRDDAVSIYIDALDDDSVTYGSDDYYFGFRQGSTDININGSLYLGSGVTKTDVVTTDGYHMEVKIDWSYLGIVPGTNNIGLDFRVDDDDDGGSRENHVLWNDETSTLWNNPSKFGILNLIDTSCDRCFSKNAPVVSLASPMVDYYDNDTVSFNISYTSDTTLSSVSYFLDGSLQKSLIASPFSFDTSGLDLGAYLSYAVVEDACGKSSSTSQVFFTVSEKIRDTVLQVQACKISAPPVIDGAEDGLWRDIPSHNMGVTEIGLTFPDPNNLSANFKIAWDVNSLYFFIKVKDDILVSDSPQMDFFRDDAVSIYIDAYDDDSVTYGSDDYYFGLRQGSTDININSSLYVGTEVTKADVVTSDGYHMEVKIDWSYIDLVPDLNNNIGLDFRVDDDDDGGSREGHVLWNDETSTLWNNPSKFGILKLIDDACPDATSVSAITKEEFSVYPNPASSEINIRTSGIKDHFISIYNSLGLEVLFSQINKSSYNIDINSLQSGPYLIILRDINLNPIGKQKLIVN